MSFCDMSHPPNALLQFVPMAVPASSAQRNVGVIGRQPASALINRSVNFVLVLMDRSDPITPP